MAAKITTLIDKIDNFELVRDQVASILAIEVANQKSLAQTAGKDVNDFDFDVYIERSSPWELIEDVDGKVIKQTPLVNVYFESGQIEGSMGDSIYHSVYNDVINIDCLSAKTAKVETGILKKGDELASRDVQRVCRLVRNILMSSVYRNLDLTGIVHSRSVSSITMFQPNINEKPAQHCIGARLVLSVQLNEYSPEAQAETLETVIGQVKRGEDGKVLIEENYNET